MKKEAAALIQDRLVEHHPAKELIAVILVVIEPEQLCLRKPGA